MQFNRSNPFPKLTLFFQMYEFCQTVKPSLEDYEADGVSRKLLFYLIGLLI
jgi:hypothetical protein